MSIRKEVFLSEHSKNSQPQVRGEKEKIKSFKSKNTHLRKPNSETVKKTPQNILEVNKRVDIIELCYMLHQ